MYVYVCICIHANAYIYIYTYVCVTVCVYIHIYMCTYIFHVYLYVYVNVYAYVYVYACVYSNIYIYIYIFIHSSIYYSICVYDLDIFICRYMVLHSQWCRLGPCRPGRCSVPFWPRNDGSTDHEPWVAEMSQHTGWMDAVQFIKVLRWKIIITITITPSPGCSITMLLTKLIFDPHKRYTEETFKTLVAVPKTAWQKAKKFLSVLNHQTGICRPSKTWFVNSEKDWENSPAR